MGSTGVTREPGHRPLLLVSYCTARPKIHRPPPAKWPGLYHTQSRATETPNGRKPLTYPNEVAWMLR